MRLLFVDLQTDGGTLAIGRPIEIAYAAAPFPAEAETPAVMTHLLRLAEGQTLPRRIETLTGIDAGMLAAGAPETEVFAAVRAAVEDCGLVVAHAAAFERAWLEALWQRQGAGRSLGRFCARWRLRGAYYRSCRAIHCARSRRASTSIWAMRAAQGRM